MARAAAERSGENVYRPQRPGPATAARAGGRSATIQQAAARRARNRSQAQAPAPIRRMSGAALSSYVAAADEGATRRARTDARLAPRRRPRANAP